MNDTGIAAVVGGGGSSSNNSSADRHVAVRPTEAQLRWAQFHHQRTAARVQRSVERLWQHPLSVADVEGALSDDGNTTNGSSSSSSSSSSIAGSRSQDAAPRALRRRSSNKPKISRGRRALLRVSMRRWKNRRDLIVKSGYGGGEYARRRDNDDDDSEDDALAAIFAEESVWKKRKRRQARTADDEERLRRFDAAFHAMMINMAASVKEENEVVAPSKRWTRPDVPLMNTMDGREYADLKWGVLPKGKSSGNRNAGTPAPLDRGASWLMHLPLNRPKRGRNLLMTSLSVDDENGDIYRAASDAGQSMLGSSTRLPFSDLVARLQQRMLTLDHQPIEVDLTMPMMRLSKYYFRAESMVDEKKDGDASEDAARCLESSPGDTKRGVGGGVVRDTIRRLTQSPPQRNRFLNEVMQKLSPELLEELERIEAGASRIILSRCIDEGGFDPASDDLDSVVPYLEVFVRRYLAECKFNGDKVHSPFSNDIITGNSSGGLVRRFVAIFEKAIESDDLVSADGKLHKATFAQLITRCLAEAKSSPLTPASSHDTELMGVVKKSITPVRHVDETKVECTIIERFISSMQEAFEQFTMIDSHGKLDSPLFTEMVTRYLAEASGSSEEMVRVVGDFDTLTDLRHVRETLSCRKSTLQILHSGSAKAHKREAAFSEAFVHQFVSKIRRAASSDPFESDDCAFDEGKFRRVVCQQLDIVLFETGRSTFNNVRSPLALAHTRQSAKRGSREDKSSSTTLKITCADGERIEYPETFIARFVESVADVMRSSNQRNLDSKEFELLVQEHLDNAYVGMHLPERSAISNVRSDENADPVSEESDRLGETRHIGGDARDAKQYVVERESVHRGSTEVQFAAEGPRDESGRFEAVTQKVGGLVRRLYHRASAKKEKLLPSYSLRNSSCQEARGDRQDIFLLPSTNNLPANQRPSSVHDTALPPNDESPQIPESTNSRTLYSPPEEFATPNFSAEKGNVFHRTLMQKSVLMGDFSTGRSVIDTDGSEASGAGMNPDALANLLLSPTILTKRHQQAMRAVERRNWDQVVYLLNANPWLAEMTDVQTNQYLLHRVALYGSNGSSVNSSEIEIGNFEPAPHRVNAELLKMFPNSVYKFDRGGNLPLHMAAVSANLPMIRLLGNSFPGGASVRNEDGMLPLHLAILACADSDLPADGTVEVISSIAKMFPEAVAVADNDGNLPIHLAAIVLRSRIGASVIHNLVNEADQLLREPLGITFRPDVRSRVVSPGQEIRLSGFQDSDSKQSPIDDTEERIHSTAAVNNEFENPIRCAVTSRAGWEIIEALVISPGGIEAATVQDSDNNTILHLLVGRYYDPTAALSLLKLVPQLTSVRNADGIFPIEIASMHGHPREIILALVLVDLPIDLRDLGKSIDPLVNFGAGWWFICCECDDSHVETVEEVVSICAQHQLRELCLVKNDHGDTLISRATPKCSEILQASLRFAGRYELLDPSPRISDKLAGYDDYDALDFGPRSTLLAIAKPVTLRRYASVEYFIQETGLIQDFGFDSSLIAGVQVTAGENGDENIHKQYCVAIDRPSITLRGVVSGMLENNDCLTDNAVRTRYMFKVFSVLRVIAKALNSLDLKGLVHGNVCLENCGKFEDGWKLCGILGAQRVGGIFESSRLAALTPPEVFGSDEEDERPSLKRDFIAQPSIDTWGFGTLAFEVLVGTPLRRTHETLEIANTAEELEKACVPKEGVDLIRACLAVIPDERPTMSEILHHPIWKELRRQVNASSAKQ